MWGHLRIVFGLLQQHTFYAKMSKYQFGKSKIEYLSHLISGRGVQTYHAKISAMVEWPNPSTLKSLRGFLGLKGYYWKFIQCYASIAAPLTDLLKKDAFIWSDRAAVAFEGLKSVVSHPPVLCLSNFRHPFTVECDALGVGVGAVLM